MFASIPSDMSNPPGHHESDNQPQFLIGPHLSNPEPSDPSTLLDEARDRVHSEDAQNKESVKLARRLFIAMILITVLGVVFYIVLPTFGVKFSPVIPILSFVAIFAGAVLTALEEQRELNAKADRYNDSESDDQSCQSDGCPTGMCAGPRPLQMFRDPPRKRNHPPKD
tara:strand:+ start:5622 stop:6125 length:504 start_codon:yes stop_codon:yes gene_type:complete